jgi:glutamine amidotransferase-like uncharacterized protein
MSQIVIYVDQGVSGLSVMHAVKSLQLDVNLDSHSIKRLDAAAIERGGWEEKSSLLIIPGGRDVYYHEALKKGGAERIRRFVTEGGSYLGICAGAYFACSEIEFEKGGPLEVCGKRPLAFFPGLGKGSALDYGNYSYENDERADAAHLSWKEGEDCHIYFNGGCFFDKASEYSAVEVLSCYKEHEDQPASIVQCQVGRGRALLSGVHLEFSARHFIKGHPHHERFLPLLEKSEEKRRQLFRALLGRLGVATS